MRETSNSVQQNSVRVDVPSSDDSWVTYLEKLVTLGVTYGFKEILNFKLITNQKMMDEQIVSYLKRSDFEFADTYHKWTEYDYIKPEVAEKHYKIVAKETLKYLNQAKDYHDDQTK